MKFVNIYFRTLKYYNANPNMVKNHLHYYNGHFTYDDVFDIEGFNKMKSKEQDYFIWNRACSILKESAGVLNNINLESAIEKVRQKGIDLNLNADFRKIEKVISLFDLSLLASVWICFNEGEMLSKFTLEDKNRVIYEFDMDKTKKCNGFFLVMYKDIKVKNSTVTIKGHKDVDYLPLKIPIRIEDLNFSFDKKS